MSQQHTIKEQPDVLLPEIFYDSLSKQYESAILSSDYYRTLYKAQKCILRRCLGNGGGEKLGLDIGCGTGFYCRELHDLDYRTRGIDICQKMVQIATQNVKAWGLNPSITIVPGRAEQIDSHSEAFDVVIAFGSVLNCIKDIPTTIKEFLRVLKPGGLAIFDIESSVGDHDNRSVRGLVLQMVETLRKEQDPCTFVWPFYFSGKPRLVKMHFIDYRTLRRIALRGGAKDVKLYGVHFFTLFLRTTLDSATLRTPQLRGVTRFAYKVCAWLDRTLMNLPILGGLMARLSSNQIIVIKN